jgi:hypothetical protein
MIRHCDGTDPNLVKYVDNSPNSNNTAKIPCNCGLTFDDTHRMVIYPHERF